MKNITFITAIIILFILIFVIVCYCLIYSEQISRLQISGINISKNWDICYCKIKECNNCTYQKISFPSYFTNGLLKYSGNFRGYVVVTKKIIIPDTWKSQPLMLSLGKIGDADQTYVNGYYIGKTGEFPPQEFSQWNKYRYYLIKPHIIRYGKSNTITIFVSCMAYNRIVGNMYIVPINLHVFDFINDISMLTLLLPLYLDIGIGITFLFIFVLLCYAEKDRIKYISFILQMIPGVLVIAESSLNMSLYYDSIVRLRIFAIGWTLLVFFHIMFLHRIYNYERKPIEIILAIITGILVLLIVQVKTILHIKYAGLIVIFVLTPLAIYNLSLHIDRLIKKDEFAKLFFLIGLILAVTASHDGIVYCSLFTFKIYSLCGYEFTSPIFQYTSFLIFIGAGLIIVYQYTTMAKEIENMNLILEKRVEERTKELTYSLENLSKAIEFGVFSLTTKTSPYFSPHLKPKITQAIVFINNNYRDTISREGLASMVNLHHDYFSKAFKYYTGKSVNEYIYELRVKEAIRLLLESKMNILDIALYVGFDSVKTFNCAFKKITRKNPSQYRK